MKRYEKSIINSIACLAFIVFLSACGNNESTVNPTPTSVSDGISDPEKEIETETPETGCIESDDISSKGNISAAGPYGRISLNLPNGWEYQICQSGDDSLPLGLYGIRIRPDTQKSGWLDLVYTDSFGVCGTGLSTEQRVIAGDKAEIGTYDEHDHWDYIAFEGINDGIVAQSDAEWLSDMKDEVWEILDTIKFDTSITEGAAFVYTSESESDEIAVAMDLSNISNTGVTVRFRQYADRSIDELIYGEGYAISRYENNEWVPVPQIMENAAFTDMGYMIPTGGEALINENWEWLYGKLPRGTYRISKTILDSQNNAYVLYGQFLLAE